MYNRHEHLLFPTQLSRPDARNIRQCVKLLNRRIYNPAR